MMTPYEVYCEYVSLKKHFTTEKYDYLKYKGKIRANSTSFKNRKDRLYFEKLAKHPDPHNFLLANLIIDDKKWIGDLAYSEEANNVYKAWLKCQQSLSYTFKQDLNKLDKNFNNNFIVENNEHPLILQRYLAGEVNLETVCILLSITGATKYWDTKMAYDLIWDMLKLKIKKYTPFINFDMEKYKKICLDNFN